MNMNNITISAVRPRTSIIDKSLSKGKGEVSLSCYALLFSELVQYCQNRVYTVPELQNNNLFGQICLLKNSLVTANFNAIDTEVTEVGADVGHRVTDLLIMRDKNGKREIKLLNILLFVKSTLWKSLFGREADKLEHANDDERTYYIIEKESLVNKYVSVPKDKGSLNCASFVAGIVEAVLCDSGF
ncbi:GSCOCG00002333001-RA-CDS, partial [Cotesia congregata]